MLVLGPTFVYIIAAIVFIVLVKLFTTGNKTIRVVKEEQLYNRAKEEAEKVRLKDRDPDPDREDVNQREALRREERLNRRRSINGQNFPSDFDDETDRDEGIV